MKKPIIKITILLLVFVFILSGCGTSEEPETSTSETEELTLTLDELREFNGKDGNPAYVAIDGVIYDVTNADPWKDGNHNSFQAGNDLTDEIKNVSPHGISKLKEVQVVGKLKD